MTKNNNNGHSPSDTKNKLRPFFRAKRKRPFWKQLQAIKRETRIEAIPAVLKIIEHNTNYPFEGMGNTFPKNKSLVPNIKLNRFEPLKASIEYEWAVQRVNMHKATILDCLEKLDEINELIAAGDFKLAQDKCEIYKSVWGHSLTIVKKELFIGVELNGLAGLLRHYRHVVVGANKTAWALLCIVFYDIADPTNNPVDATLRWRNFAAKRLAKNDWYARLIEQEILGLATCEEDFVASILRYQGTSLLDLVLYIRKHYLFSPSIALSLFDGIDKELLYALSNHGSDILVPVHGSRGHSRHRASDLDFYRSSLFFDDINNSSLWRFQFNEHIFGLENSSSPLHIVGTGHIQTLVQILIHEPSKLDEIIVAAKDWQRSPFNTNNEDYDTALLKTSLAAAVLRKVSSNKGERSKTLSHLFAAVPDAAQFVSVESIVTIAEAAEHDDIFLSFVMRELAYRKARTFDNELERRLTFMKLFPSGDKAEIQIFLDKVHKESSESAIFIAKTCTRSFLEKLFLIMNSLKDVLETRIEICRWLESHIKNHDAAITEEREALEREYSNLDARSDLDSTRVHVDEDALREWYINTQSNNQLRYIQTVLAEGPDARQGMTISALTLLNKKREIDEEQINEETDLSSELMLINIVDQTLKTFATDRSFGLDAYLSRRIRHGSLSGQIMTPVTKVLRQLPDLITAFRSSHNLAPNHEFEERVSELLRQIAARLDHIRRDIIQLKDDKRVNGLIKATWKSAANVAHLDAMIVRARERVADTHGSYDAFGDIYALCWDCLEPDLAQLRLYMLRVFLPQVISDVVVLFESLLPPEQNFAANTFGEARRVIEARVHEVCGWFIRPVFRRDKYDLRTLIDSTLSIVRELDESFKFREDVVMESDVSLNRGSFDVFGDALFVLIGNAAKHGISDGLISVEVQTDPKIHHAIVHLRSQVSNIDEYNNSSTRIREAMQTKAASDLRRAAVEEGNSGIQKLAGMIQRVRTTEAKLIFKPNVHDLAMNFELSLPEEITFVRIRG